MKRKEYRLTLVIVLVAGLLIGFFTSQIIQSAFAQEKTKKTDVPKINWMEEIRKGREEQEKREREYREELRKIQVEEERKKKEAQKKWEARVKKWEETKGKQWLKGLKEIGRFQVLTEKDGLYIFDTKQGHVWEVLLHQGLIRRLIYLGQLLPIREED